MKFVNENHTMISRFARVILGVVTFAVLAATLVAQPPTKPNRIKEDEEGATTPAAPVKPAKQPPKLQPITWGPFILADEAKAATHPEVKKYLQDLALNADEVTTVAGKVYRTAPIHKKYDPKEGKPLDFTPLDGARTVLSAEQIKSVAHYEERVLEKTRQFLEKRLDNPNTPPVLSRFLQLRAAEMVITEGHRYHQTLLAQSNRDARSWAGMEAELKNKLFDVRVDEMRALTAERDYATAEALAQKMFQATPGDRVLLDVIEQLYVKVCDDQFAENNFLQARLVLEGLRDRYRNPLTSLPTRRVVERLEDHARKNFDAAKKAIDDKNRSQALSALETAEQAWPTLPGLREFRVKVLGEYSVLRVGVRESACHFLAVDCHDRC